MYASMVVPVFVSSEYIRCLPPDFKYETIVWDMVKHSMRFDEAPDFNTAREPHPGVTYTVCENMHVTRRVVNQIWHHKWLWVLENYGRFNVEESREWSRTWLAKVGAVASGWPEKWEEQLRKYGVESS
jgi:hypothetical protein